MIIREFAPADQPGIVKLQEEFMIEFFPEYVHDPRQLEWNADIYDIADCYIKKGGKIWVAEIASDIVGFGGFRLVDAATAEIKRIRISSLHRGKGIGKSIVNAIEDYCRTSSIQRILVDTDKNLRVANSMYRNMGYSVYKSETEVENGVEYTDIFFEKKLD
jgi:GNAT superfamily N-acetyltransferase